jgi:hypothetical protein
MRFPVILTAPDGRRITCWDGEHAAAVHVLTDWLVWAKVSRLVRDHDGDINWTALEAEAPLYASSERLLAAAAMDLYALGSTPSRRPPSSGSAMSWRPSIWPGCWRRSACCARTPPHPASAKLSAVELAGTPRGVVAGE